jgi:competence protein ComEA
VRALIAAVAVLLVVVAWWWMRSPEQPASIEVPVVASSAAPIADVVVHVAGRVKQPGLIRLPTGSRVADAIEAAGGAVKDRDLDSVNLARMLVDGEQIQVGAAAEGGDSGINVNSASAAELEDLPGVGPVLAQRIVEWRTANGPFTSIDDLGQVSGIGASVLGQIREVARV